MNTVINEASVRRATLKGEPTEVCGLPFYGLQVSQYEEWQTIKSVLLRRQTTLPVFCLALPFIDAMFALEVRAIEETGQAVGLMNVIMNGMAMALKMPASSVRDKLIRLNVANGDLKGFFIAEQAGFDSAFVPKAAFHSIRQVIAWQQGDELPDESLNDDLLETEKDLAARNALNLKLSFEDLLASVALNLHMRIADIDNMSILEFETMRRAIDRDKRHMICAIAEGSGTRWTSGNPCPSWVYDKESKESGALVAASKFSGMAQK